MSKAVEKSEKPKDKGEKTDVPIDQVFGALEQRVEGLSDRFRQLAAENARLKGVVAEASIGQERAEKALEELQKTVAAQGESADKLSRMEAEREQVRARLERLLTSLEEAEAGEA